MFKEIKAFFSCPRITTLDLRPESAKELWCDWLWID